jgi:hypothetical protein
MAGRTTRAAICLSVCVFITDICELRPGQPLRGAERGAHAGLARPSCPVHPVCLSWCPGRFGPPIVPCAPPCVSLGLKKPGHFTVSEGHGYPLVLMKGS